MGAVNFEGRAMTAENSEGAMILAEKNKRLLELVAELLKKNEGLRQQLEAAKRAGALSRAEL